MGNIISLEERRKAKREEVSSCPDLNDGLLLELRKMWHEGVRNRVSFATCYKCHAEDRLAVSLTITEARNTVCTAAVSLKCGACGWSRKWFGYVQRDLVTGFYLGEISSNPVSVKEISGVGD